MKFKRKIYDKMLEWKKSSNGRRALMLKGARRVGKSTIAEEFAKREYKTYILIDFSYASKAVQELFDDISDLNFLFLHLQMLYKVQLYERQSVIIFDEVQLAPKARQAIKHLVADGRYDYIETGSLIGIRKFTQNIVVPSEETHLEMHPMDYEEFRWALGDTVSVPLLRQCFSNMQRIHDATMRSMMRDYRLYVLIGGMPQAVKEYIDTNNLARVDEMKRSILTLYDTDLRKIDPTGRAALIFDNLPAQLSHGSTRYHVSQVIDNQRTENILPILEDMRNSMMVNIAYHADDPNVGMLLTRNLNRFKLYMNDTGLFVTAIFKDKQTTDNIIYSKLLSDKLNVNQGYIFENAVAQTLRANGDGLFYYTFPSETSRHNYEIDFLISRGNKLCPIEVKSSSTNKHASLDHFCTKYSQRIAKRYIISNKPLHSDADITYVPYCMAMCL